jgi:secreted trypsin-like serine protease
VKERIASKRRLAQLALASGLAFAVLGALSQAAPASGGRIFGGGFTTTTKYPWQVAVQLDDQVTPGQTNFDRQWCGGALLTSRIVITAAHCVLDEGNGTPTGLSHGDGYMDANDLDVIRGFSSLNSAGNGRDSITTVYNDSPNTLSGGQLGDIAAPIGAEVWTLEVNDFAFIVLANATSLTPIKLAGPTETALWAQGRDAQATGWGGVNTAGDIASDVLKETTGQILPDSSCSAVATSAAGPFYPSFQLCFGLPAGGNEVCFGDSGGPLSVPGLENVPGGAPQPVYRLVGTVSKGFADVCGLPNYPDAFQRVGSDPTQAAIVRDVATIESIHGIPHTNIVGTGALLPFVCGTGGSTAAGFATDDVLTGGNPADVISGLDGKDKISGFGGKDVICGGNGNDKLKGGPGKDILIGGPGRDKLFGGGGKDKLRGGPGRDSQNQ